MRTVPSKHLFGVEFFRRPDMESLDEDGYFQVMCLVRPLLASPVFTEVTPGFYVNYITNPDDGKNSLRISCYSIAPGKTLDAIKEFIAKEGTLALFESQWTVRPDPSATLTECFGETLNFERFLNTNSAVVLEVMAGYGEKSFQELVVEYRHKLLPQRIPPDRVFGDLFETFSEYFRELKLSGADRRYWSDLVYFFNQRDFGLHFMVNMVGVDDAKYDRRFFENDWILWR